MQLHSNPRTKQGKQEEELPKINKTFLVNPKQSETYVDRLGWVADPCDYSSKPNEEITLEHKKLRKELLEINSDIAKNIDKIGLKAIKRVKNAVPPEKIYEIRDRECENNNQIIERLKRELESLERRAKSVTVTTRDDIEVTINQVKEKITKKRQKIKELKLKSKAIGDSIENNDTIYEEIHRLQSEKEGQQKRIQKIRFKIQDSSQAMKRMDDKIEQIAPSYALAESYLESLKTTSKTEDDDCKLLQMHRQKCYQLQIVMKHCDSVNQSKQQRYHQGLKTLESTVEKMALLDAKMNEAEAKNLEGRKISTRLQQLLKQTQEGSKQKLDDNAFFTEIDRNMEQIAGNEVEDDKIKRKFQSITRSKNISVNSPYDRVQPPLNVVVTEKAFHKKKNNRTDNDSEVKIIPSRQRNTPLQSQEIQSIQVQPGNSFKKQSLVQSDATTHNPVPLILPNIESNGVAGGGNSNIDNVIMDRKGIQPLNLMDKQDEITASKRMSTNEAPKDKRMPVKAPQKSKPKILNSVSMDHPSLKKDSEPVRQPVDNKLKVPRYTPEGEDDKILADFRSSIEESRQNKSQKMITEIDLSAVYKNLQSVSAIEKGDNKSKQNVAK